ncbi:MULTISPECIES: DUF3034 family protein [Alteromonas]|jgi:hypothetical protein|uniref:DUF3034 family protein n=1 Tax=Alteromonas hispanica TaxID=315421 RepID=A0A6L9MYM1_9ALTE|nr:MULTISPECIES: DUF3034 family protein [Alteromonas]AUC89585.1 DUF3034 domain-containing protein [Alteromonas sp. MB-3u-76]MAI66079.1 hypothetical protein [Alteromonas sp.]NDW22750.1 DUF3034 family protein [Alteromonas hispanica]
MKHYFFVLSALVCLIASNYALAGDGKLLATSGLVQIEGSGGGGIVPWATLSGYDTQDEISVSAVMTQVDLDDYRLNVMGVSASFYDRVEISAAHQRFDLKQLGGDIRQNVIGVKYRLYGDAVYSNFPQISIGLQHKKLEDGAIADLLGADSSSSGTDYYIAATKIHLGAVAGFNAVWNVTARATKANQLGLLGFGGAQNSDHEIMLEASAGVLLSRNVAVGMEYRQKPDNLGLGEEDWIDYFVSYIPNKHIALTLAWAELGSIAGAEDQNGLYLSINGQLW